MQVKTCFICIKDYKIIYYWFYTEQNVLLTKDIFLEFTQCMFSFGGVQDKMATVFCVAMDTLVAVTTKLKRLAVVIQGALWMVTHL